ncbi:hypothetical protein BHE90_002210 [Fusarium euwallaceae]|uniref:Uncharacterized protein n=1 Tax=Fusarium euwallaceae TaxID=1147111 RepID=A0A430M5J3_9HYPO|nr:hypothetical protein BHE90_002210 [Fusarium euwallaceae]
MSPGYPQFGSESDAMSGLDYSSSTDVDLANILYVQNIPIVPTKKKDELDARIKSIETWLAWELTRVEDALQNKMQRGDVPKDDSMDSKLKRMSYRSKVLTFERERQRWLHQISGSGTHKSQTSAWEDKINLAVTHSILDAFGTSNSPQILNVLKAVGSGFNGLVQTSQSHVFCVIDYTNDTMLDQITATVKTFFFNVTVREGRGPSSHPGRRDPFATREPKFYEAEVIYTHSGTSFDFGLWDQTAQMVATHSALGNQVLAHRQLRLLKE